MTILSTKGEERMSEKDIQDNLDVKDIAEWTIKKSGKVDMNPEPSK